MSSTIVPSEAPTREFEAGTTGWTAADLDDPEFERFWDAGSYEIVEGVLTIMPPAYFDGSAALNRLVSIVQAHLDATHAGGAFGPEADLIIEGKRVPRPDMVYLTDADLRRQQELNAQRARGARRIRKYGRLLIPPTLIIESLSEGHESHDRETKWQWYAKFGVPNYWLLDAQARTLECLVLRGEAYQVDVTGKGEDEVRPSLFPNLAIALSRVWL